jgi:hypothetical protein
MPTFQDTHTDDDLARAIERVRNQYLTWVEQVLDLIEENLGVDFEGTVNDIGCNVGHFYKGLKRRDLRLEYRGYDVEQIYLDEAVKIFAELDGNLSLLDITAQAPPPADVAVMSATLEHLEHPRPALDHLLEGATRLVVLRTFLGEVPLRAVQQIAGAPNHYFAHQYSFQEVLDGFAEHDFWPVVVRDRHTDSMPIYMTNGIIRAHHLVVGTKRD